MMTPMLPPKLSLKPYRHRESRLAGAQCLRIDRIRMARFGRGQRRNDVAVWRISGEDVARYEGRVVEISSWEDDDGMHCLRVNVMPC